MNKEILGIIIALLDGMAAFAKAMTEQANSVDSE